MGLNEVASAHDNSTLVTRPMSSTPWTYKTSLSFSVCGHVRLVKPLPVNDYVRHMTSVR